MPDFQHSDFVPHSPKPAISTPLAAECEACAPLLTAWFDGEANERDLELVRRHLATCQPCAATWRGWEHTRFLLRSTPTPPPPVGLLTRILQACRLSALLPRRKNNAVRGVASQSTLRSA